MKSHSSVGINVGIRDVGNDHPGAVCIGTPEESGPTGVTKLNLIVTKLSDATDSDTILILVSFRVFIYTHMLLYFF